MKLRVTKQQIGTKRKIALDEYVCDNCGESQVVERNAMTDAFGFHGVTQEVDITGGTRADWFACKEECIFPAIKAALKKSRET